jgi:hypothetical protein
VAISVLFFELSLRASWRGNPTLWVVPSLSRDLIRSRPFLVILSKAKDLIGMTFGHASTDANINRDRMRRPPLKLLDFYFDLWYGITIHCS